MNDKGELTIQSGHGEMSRNFFEKHGVLDLLEGTVDNNMRRLQKEQASEAWKFLFRIKSAIRHIRKHYRQGDDVHALVFDLGCQVVEATRFDLPINIEPIRHEKTVTVRKTRVGKSGYTINHLKSVAKKKYYEALNRVESFGKKETAYLEAKKAVYKECNEVRSLATIKRWILTK